MNLGTQGKIPQLKYVVLAISFLFLVYGYYGYVHVPQQTAGFGETAPTCPFGYEQTSGFGMDAGPCLHSFLSLIVGFALLVVIVVIPFMKKKG